MEILKNPNFRESKKWKELAKAYTMFRVEICANYTEH